MNYTIGEEFLFTCSATTNVDALIFSVNGMNAADQIIIDQGYSQSGIVINGDLSTRQLTGTAQIQHNETNITCSAFKSGQGDAASDIAVYKVQGNGSSIMYIIHDHCYCLVISVITIVSIIQVHYHQLVVYLILSLIPLLLILHGVHHSLYLVLISLDIIYQ